MAHGGRNPEPLKILAAGSGAALAVALTLSTSAFAQDAATASADPDGTGTEHLHLPGYEPATGSSSLELGIAPELVSHNPLRPGTQTSDALDLSLTFITIQPLSRTLEVEFDAGATKTIDNGSSSALAAAVELRTRPDDAGFSLFLNYAVERDYADFFDRGEATTHTVTTGLRFGREIGATEIGLELAPRWEHSSIAADNHGAINLRGEVVTPLIGDKVLFILDTSVERRWYENRDPVALASRRDWRFATYLGLDLAGVFARRRWLHDLSVGVEWLEVSSNVDDADRSELVLLPAVSIGISF